MIQKWGQTLDLEPKLEKKSGIFDDVLRSPPNAIFPTGENENCTTF